jgi:hypothetical protein
VSILRQEDIDRLKRFGLDNDLSHNRPRWVQEGREAYRAMAPMMAPAKPREENLISPLALRLRGAPIFKSAMTTGQRQHFRAPLKNLLAESAARFILDRWWADVSR